MHVSSSNLNILKSRLDGIQKILIAHRDASAALPNASKGIERETLVRNFLDEVFPPPFRFGSGSIVDGFGRFTGQLDVVVEFPFLPSFPTPGTSERLYLADSTAVVIEVKSDISAQWEQVTEKAKQILPMRRNWYSHHSVDDEGNSQTFHESPPSRVPFLVVGYRGPKNITGLRKLIEKVPADERPDGVLVIEAGVYSGCIFNNWTSSSVGAGGLFGFCADMAWLARNVTWSAPNLHNYIDNLKGEVG